MEVFVPYLLWGACHGNLGLDSPLAAMEDASSGLLDRDAAGWLCRTDGDV
jgi:hypothetical protein